MPTESNLKTAFAGESQARSKYLAFSRKADEEGFKGVAKLFRAAAEAETIHALMELKTLGGICSTADNLKEAISGETYEFTEMYPSFMDEAKGDENAKDALRVFQRANEAEKVHADLYSKELESLDAKGDYDFYVCSVCGNIVKGAAPDKCSICGAPSSRFINVG